jgi:hypothetical protein
MYNTWTTLMTKKRDTGKVRAISSREKRVSSWEQMPCPSSQAGKKTIFLCNSNTIAANTISIIKYTDKKRKSNFHCI